MRMLDMRWPVRAPRTSTSVTASVVRQSVSRRLAYVCHSRHRSRLAGALAGARPPAHDSTSPCTVRTLRHARSSPEIRRGGASLRRGHPATRESGNVKRRRYDATRCYHDATTEVDTCKFFAALQCRYIFYHFILLIVTSSSEIFVHLNSAVNESKRLEPRLPVAFLYGRC